MNDQQPTVTEVRTALIRDAADFGDRRRTHHQAMRAIPADMRQNNPHFDALFDAYEGFATSGCYAQTLAAVLRIVAARDPKTADELASLVHDVMENGDDCLDGPNDDVWALIDRQQQHAAAKAARHFSPGYQGEIPDHHGPADTCAMPACAAARARHEAAADIQDLTYELLADEPKAGA